MNIISPSILFSGLCLLLGAYNNIYLFLSSRIREICKKNVEKDNNIKNKHRLIAVYMQRLRYLKYMQLFAVFSLLLSTLSILFILFNILKIGELIFILALISFLLSLIFALKDLIYFGKNIREGILC